MYRTIATSFALIALALATPATAQDVFMPGTSPMDLAPQSQALTSSVIGNLSVGDTARGGGGGRVSPGIAASRGGGLAFSPARTSDARLPYASSPASRKQALAEYVGRIRRTNPKVAADTGRALGAVDVHRIFVDAARPYGLSADDAADVMAGFLSMGWEIITGGDPSAAATRGIRRQVAGQLVGNPAMRDPATRAKFAEELKIQFVVIGSGFMSAQKEGNVAQYRRGVADFYRQQTGQDIGRWRLTSAGFAK